jgi:hypothetical protein
MGSAASPTSKYSSRKDLEPELAIQAELEARRTAKGVDRILVALRRGKPVDPESLRMAAVFASEEAFGLALDAALKGGLVSQRPGSGGRNGRPIVISAAGLARLEKPRKPAPMDPTFRKPDRRRNLETLRAGSKPMTTAQLAGVLDLPLERVGRTVHLLVQEHQLEVGPRKPDGYSWLLGEIGLAELGRAEAVETGKPFRDADPDEAEINATLRSIGR